MKECAFDGCIEPAVSRGLCNGHRMARDEGRPLKPLIRRKKKPKKKCRLVWCDREARALGLCQRHWAIQRAGQPLGPLKGQRLFEIIHGEKYYARPNGRPPANGNGNGHSSSQIPAPDEIPAPIACAVETAPNGNGRTNGTGKPPAIDRPRTYRPSPLGSRTSAWFSD